MPFVVRPTDLADEILATTNALRREFLGGTPPKWLFHYTCSKAVVNIIDFRNIWATCVADVSDNTEVVHGVKIVSREVQRRIHASPPFAQMVLSNVAEKIKSRISRTFVLCFCGDSNSTFHWRKFGKLRGYGDYCLRFETSVTGEPLLRPQFGGSCVQYNRVIYGRRRQRYAVKTAVDAIVMAIERSTGGTPEGPWMQSLARLVTRDVSELLLDLVVCFKSRCYFLDREWRLVVRPDSALCSSASEMADTAFDVLVRETPRRHIELYASIPTALFCPTLVPSTPFSDVLESPFLKSLAERQSILHALSENGRPDIEIRKVKWLGFLSVPLR